jgi:hypothetical protein
MTPQRGFGCMYDKPEETPITIQPYLNRNNRVHIAIYLSPNSEAKFDDYIGFSHKAMTYFTDDISRTYDAAQTARAALFTQLAEHIEDIQDGTDDPKNTIYTVAIPKTSYVAISHMQMIAERLVVFMGILHRNEAAPFKQDLLKQTVPHLH